MGYKKDAIKGVSWLGFFRIVFRSLTFIKLAILARVLTPSEFGQVDIAIIVLALVEIFTETGINVFLIQQNEEVDDYINTAWVVSIVRGFLIGGIIFITIPFIADFFKSPQSRHFLYLIVLVPIIRGFINPSVAKFLKNLNYDKQFFYRASITVIETVTVIIIVTSFNNPIGIIIGLVIGALWEVILTFKYASPTPFFKFERFKFKRIIFSGKWLTLSGIFDYLYLNLDNILIGRFLGTGSLGLYMRAYSISLLPITEISDVFNQSTFPIYVKISGDKNRLRSAYLKTLYIVSLIVVPVGIIFLIFTKPLIQIILGNSWLEITSVLRVLVIYGVLRAILRTNIGLFYSTKRQDIITRITAVNLLGMAITILPLIQYWGIIGAGISAIIGTILSIPLAIYYTTKLLK